MIASCRYWAFGLLIASEIELPELAPAPDRSGPVDVHIRLGAVEPWLEGAEPVEPGVWSRSDVLLLDFGPARYLVRAGREIVVQPAAGGSARDLRVYLLGSALGGLCHQRGLLPLHANAIEIAGAAIAFMGSSGAGKSTLAGRLLQRGYRILCDDVCVAGFDAAGGPIAWPGVRRIKLWRDAVDAMGLEAAGLEPVSDDDDKFSLPAPHDSPRAPLPLKRIYILDEAEDEAVPSIRRLSGGEAFDFVWANLYRLALVTSDPEKQAQFHRILILVGAVEVFLVKRRWGYSHIDEEVDRLINHATM